jgi:hypothetical protein
MGGIEGSEFGRVDGHCGETEVGEGKEDRERHAQMCILYDYGCGMSGVMALEGYFRGECKCQCG